MYKNMACGIAAVVAGAALSAAGANGAGSPGTAAAAAQVAGAGSAGTSPAAAPSGSRLWRLVGAVRWLGDPGCDRAERPVRRAGWKPLNQDLPVTHQATGTLNASGDLSLFLRIRDRHIIGVRKAVMAMRDLPVTSRVAIPEHQGMGAMKEQPPLGYRAALRALTGCVLSTGRLLRQRRIHLPARHVGMRLRFADGTSARVYRETVVDRIPTQDPCILVVEFRLRAVHGRGHAAFRWESLLNTPLFVGFPGFVSKLWLAHDERGRYRGLYEWDGPQRADAYARALWRVLALVSVPGSIHYIVLPGLRRDEMLGQLPGSAAADGAAWWRPVERS